MTHALRLRAIVLPAIVLALVLAALFIGVHRYSSTANLRPIQSNYEGGTRGAVSTAGVATAVVRSATFTG